MQAKLDLYVSDELDGINVHGRHPDVWSHLQLCPLCRQEHDSLIDLLTAEARGELTALPPRAPMVRASAEPPWRVFFETEGRARPELLFVFAPVYLRQSLRPAHVAKGLRIAEPRPSLDSLLVSYLDDTPAGEVMVQLSARPDAIDPSSCFLKVVAVAEPMPRVVTLTWAGQTFEATFNADGDAQFGPMPLAPLDSGDWPVNAFSLRVQI